MGKTPFFVVYTKAPTHSTKLIQIPVLKNRASKNPADRIIKTIKEVGASLHKSNLKYKVTADTL